jgi:hypothetical protein
MSSTLWSEQFRENPAAAEWALLGAALARVDCDRDFSSPVHAERLRWCREVFARLLARDGLTFAAADYHRIVILNRFRPGWESESRR